jgi:hypothetical protein
MAKVWKAGDRIPVEHVNALEEKAEELAKLQKVSEPKKPREADKAKE